MSETIRCVGVDGHGGGDDDDDDGDEPLPLAQTVNSSNLISSTTTTTTTTTTTGTSNSDACRYYAKGICRFGDMCRFSHELDVVSNPNDMDVNTSTTATIIIPSDPRSWVMAPVFVPRAQAVAAATTTNTTTTTVPPPSFAQVVRYPMQSVIPYENGDTSIAPTDVAAAEAAAVYEDMCENAGGPSTAATYCPHSLNGGIHTRIGVENCIYYHGDLCDMCNFFCLDPNDEEQRRTHRMKCVRQHETAMELSFAIARSKDKTCGVCFEVIIEKSGSEKRFGILPNCNHIFCLQCIRKWRQSKQFDNKIIRACPECRVTSDFVCPSPLWVDTKEEKDRLIKDYLVALEEKDCKYFKQGQAKCPFGNKCFYRHALPNGQLVDVGLPQRPPRRQNHLGEFDGFQELYLWDWIDDHDRRWLDDLASFLSDTDSDWSDYDIVDTAYTFNS